VLEFGQTSHTSVSPTLGLMFTLTEQEFLRRTHKDYFC